MGSSTVCAVDLRQCARDAVPVDMVDTVVSILEFSNRPYAVTSLDIILEGRQ